VRIREQRDLGKEQGGYTAEYTAASIEELDQQYADGEIERHAYFMKKRVLVRLYLKATTSPRRRRRDESDWLD